MELTEALAKLDPKNDEHWTQDGSPRVDVVSTFMGRDVKRIEITDAAPHLKRDNAIEPAEEEAQTLSDADQEAIEQLDVLDLPLGTIIGAGRIDEALEALNKRNIKLRAEKEEINLKLGYINDYVQVLEKLKNRSKGSYEDQQREQRQAYIKSQNEARVARGERLKQLTEKGLTPADVRAAVASVAPADAPRPRQRNIGAERPNQTLNK